MPDWQALSQNFDYDLWANLLWLECLERRGFPARETAILGHSLSAQDIWLRRVQGESLAAMPKVEVSETEMRRLAAGWKAVLDHASADREITYRRTTGEEFTVPLSHIARHVANHGTYHRGELRGLCLAAGDDEFPETDLVVFLLMKPPV